MTVRNFRERTLLVVLIAGAPGVTTCGSASTVDASPNPAAQVNLSVSPTPIAVTEGGSGSGTITYTRTSANTGALTLAAAGLPSGITATFNPSSVTGRSGSSQLTIKAANDAAVFFDTIVVTARASGEDGRLAVRLSVSQPRITVTRSGSGPGTVTSTPLGINCGSTCTADFPAGISVTFTAVAAPGSAFAGWSGACSGTDNKCSITSSATNGAAATNVIATFNSTACASPPPSPPAWPSLSDYFTVIPAQTIASNYAPRFITPPFTADLNGDGNDDLVVLGLNYAFTGEPVNVPQPGRVFLGDGNGNFTAAPSDLFPVATLNTVTPRKVLFGDFNGDGRLDMYVASHGWDTQPYPGEQNLLFLSQPGGGWKDATATLPQLSDYSHSAAFGDIRHRGVMDIVVGNYFAPQPNHVLPYALLNNGSGQFTLSRDIIPVASGQTMDTDSGHYLLGLTLADLNSDGLPDLVVLGDATDATKKLRHTTVLWNRTGAFNDADKAELPEPSAFPTHIDLDAQSIDLNHDGLPDLVVIGSQGQPFYDGWFVQLLINLGNGTFVDETACRISAGDTFGGTPGVATGTTWPRWVKVVDFNGDGFPISPWSISHPARDCREVRPWST